MLKMSFGKMSTPGCSTLGFRVPTDPKAMMDEQF